MVAPLGYPAAAMAGTLAALYTEAIQADPGLSMTAFFPPFSLKVCTSHKRGQIAARSRPDEHESRMTQVYMEKLRPGYMVMPCRVALVPGPIACHCFRKRYLGRTSGIVRAAERVVLVK